ncbi:GNAT family N-acetyltransferase [Falsihalocynthiibacter arcticus]|uniref:Drug:proton antiporter n=1 Tax=Falsihalocynthiibacter arcticus TaxID=1579316 RepID=A0A126UZX4_9RHOB|nr:GNAT family N-acetyltransferase [Falsihalocynthiibacter arcticus]AML50999.1 drug:proton antiporter [Falsihalocynthiibacter arcticus]
MTVAIEVTEDVATCIGLRMEVFVGEQGIPVEEEIDAYDDDAVHLLAVDENVPVGTARLLLLGDTGRIGRVCVVKSHRGTGLGAALITAGLTHFSTLEGVRRAYLSAQVQALGFYEKLGFLPYGPEYDDAGIPHRDMERLL